MDRLAKLEAWKQKLAAERDSKQKQQPPGGTRGLLDEMDRKAEAEATMSPAEPSAPEPAPAEGLDEEEPAPAQYAGKFDPKAIAKKASAATNSSAKLGLDVALLKNANVSAVPVAQVNGMNANKLTATAPQPSSESPCKRIP